MSGTYQHDNLRRKQMSKLTSSRSYLYKRNHSFIAKLTQRVIAYAFIILVIHVMVWIVSSNIDKFS